MELGGESGPTDVSYTKLSLISIGSQTMSELTSEEDIDRVFDTAKAVAKTLLPLSSAARCRVLKFVLDKFAEDYARSLDDD